MNKPNNNIAIQDNSFFNAFQTCHYFINIADYIILKLTLPKGITFNCFYFNYNILFGYVGFAVDFDAYEIVCYDQSARDTLCVGQNRTRTLVFY